MSSHNQEGSPLPSSSAHQGNAQLVPLLRPKSTPVIKKQNGHAPFASEVPGDIKQIRLPLALEMTGRWVGPMPVDEFLDNFLPPVPEQLPSLPDDPFQELFTQSSESHRYAPFVSIFQIRAVQGWMLGFVAVNTSNRADADEKLKTDVSIYRADNEVLIRTNFSQMELWIEFKKTAEGLPFQDPKAQSLGASNEPTPFIPETDSGRVARGQLITYAVAHHARQFRHFSFSIFIADNHARFLRWDHAGTIVTATFNFRHYPEIMASFLWRFSHLSEEQRGYVISVRPANLPSYVAQRVRKDLGLEDITIPLFQYDLPGMSSKGHGYGPFPPLPARSLVCRSTRSLPVFYIPVQPQQNEAVSSHPDSGSPDDSEDPLPWVSEGVVYLKDTWRFLSNDSHTRVMAEHEIYELLHEKKTPNIPQHVDGGDVPGGLTQTQNLLGADWLSVKVSVTPFQHYRLVLDVVGRPLTKFNCTKELVQAICDAMKAHWHAYQIVDILHRDISVGNILLTDDGHGLLIDWEMGKLVNDVGARRYDRTGTWQFMSAALLRDTHKMHTLSDDIESFIHVVGWLVLRYVPSSNFSSEERAANMKKFDDADFGLEGHTYGGQRKELALAAGKYPAPRFQFARPTRLSSLLRSLCEPFKSLYDETPPTTEDRAKLCASASKSDSKLRKLAYDIEVYDEAMERLASSTWFIETIEAALGEDDWPEDDGADETVYRPSTGLLTEQQEQQRASRLLASQNHFAASKCSSGSSTSKRRPASPTPEPGAKRRRGISAPLTSSSHLTS